MRPLTLRQVRILNFIGKVQYHRGYPPSVREIAEAVGLRSTSSVHAQLATLERRGYIKRDPHRARALVLSHITGEGT